MTLQEEVVLLRAENAELRRRLTVAEARIAELGSYVEQKASAPPLHVKANRAKAERPQQPRRKRTPRHNTSRRRQTPTRIERHALARCPNCGYHLSGKSVDYTRQVIELLPPQPVGVTEYQVIKRWCPHCQRWHSPRLDLSQTVLGRRRIGVRIAALIAYLRTELRMTIRQIQAYGYTVQELWLSIGEITALLHRVRQAGQTAIESLKEQMRRAEVVHADETGWRQDGQKGYVWVFVTLGADSIRYYEHDSSRAQHVVKRIMGSVTGREHKLCLVTDFNGAYNDYAGPQQWCWVHLLGGSA